MNQRSDGGSGRGRKRAAPGKSKAPRARAAKGERGPRGNLRGAGRSRDTRRRPLATTEARGTISTSGDPDLSSALAKSLAAANQEPGIAQSLTHPIHSYPARMHPATARALVTLVAELSAKPIIFDPFCGSGTTLVEAQYAGLGAIGIDANPLAVRISRAKTWTAPRREREQVRARGRRIASRALAESKAARRSGYEAPPWRERKDGDEILAASFLKHTRRELEFLYSSILKENQATAEILLVALSSILHKVSLRASDSDPSLVQRRIARGAPSRLFSDRVDALMDGLDELARAGRAPLPQITVGDARRLPATTAGAVITSPPYPGTYDYASHHELRMAFLELDDSLISSREIGARRRGGGRAALAQWRADTKTWLEQAAKTVGSGRFVAAVVGDSVAGRGALLADVELKRQAPSSLEWVASAAQTRAKRGGREREAFGQRPKQEHVVLFRSQP